MVAPWKVFLPGPGWHSDSIYHFPHMAWIVAFRRLLLGTVRLILEDMMRPL